jgi:HEPN domain-containing protein
VPKIDTPDTMVSSVVFVGLVQSMLSRSELRKIARARFQDARVLFRGRRYDGAVYLCGYTVELALKARICTVLHWPGFPSTQAEFRGLQSFKVHELDMLLRLAGREAKIRAAHSADWSVVAQWDPELRYQSIGTASRAVASSMISSTERLLKVL